MLGEEWIRMRQLYTIGHSSHVPEHFLGLLRQYGVEVLVDTRSTPYSQYSPQFDRELLRKMVLAAGVKYLFLGDAVGGRPKDKDQYDEQGRVLYSKVGKDTDFLRGIDRLEHGAGEFRVALMCSEEDPAHCHRRLLIGRVLVERGVELLHIRGKGQLETEAELVARSGKQLSDVQGELFAEMHEGKWRSTASVLRKNQQPSSLER
jgi:uncharacterized protein (DUF488 family)